ncbi:RsmG family class I SAM-dependent methyltransferase [Ilumatobacter sp.]|uniref:RsmG family class I SAM-dependent methyltransferase n=1 Tax=Ilumatobacter sp. TaxID=1967498 RepID=UPI003B52A233
MSSSVEVLEVLEESRRQGFLGDRSVEQVVEHAQAFVAALTTVNGEVADLGSGGGVPGLVIADGRPDLRLVLVDRRRKRTDFLARAVSRLGWRERVEIISGDVADVVADGRCFDGAVARGFGPPESTLATASSLTVDGGLVVISEPPTGDRWPPHVLSAASVERVGSPDDRVAVFRRLPRSIHER